MKFNTRHDRCKILVLKLIMCRVKQMLMENLSNCINKANIPT